eukprot:6180986-Pleurochrysis_carterae.AAC.2
MNALSAVTVGSGIPRTSRECIMAEMVALVAVDAALASAERRRRSSLPLPLHASEYVRRAAVHEMLPQSVLEQLCNVWLRRPSEEADQNLGRKRRMRVRPSERLSTRPFASASAFAAL